MKASIINYEHLFEDKDFRLDARFYHPDRISNSEILKKKAKITVGNFIDHVKKPASPNNNNNLPVYDKRGSCFHILDLYLAESKERSSLKKVAKGGDVVVSRLEPHLRQVGYIPASIKEAHLTTEFLVLRSSDNEDISFLTAFFLTRQVQEILFWCQAGTRHARFKEEDLLNISIPESILHLRNLLNKMMLTSADFLSKCFSLYLESENFMLEEIGLASWKPRPILTFTKRFTEVRNSDRIDAPYFHPKHDDIANFMQKYKNGFDSLENLLGIKGKNFYPNENQKYKYIEISNIVSSGFINGCTEDFGENLPTRARRQIATGDVIVSSIQGSIDSVALVSEEWNGALCSNGFFVINSDSINSETLFMFMKSQIGQMQLKRQCRGAILAAMRKEDFLKILIPKFENDFQEKMKEKVTQMYKAKKMSQSLIEIATRGVEIAIEEDEKVAEKWIQAELKRLNITL